MFRQYGLSAKSGPWPVADVMLDWSLAPRGAAVTYHLRDRESETTLAIGRFVSRDEYVFPHEPFLSDNGRTLLLIAELRLQGQGVAYKDAAVDLPVATALLYVDAAASAPGNAKLHARAQAACDAVGSP